MGRKDFIMKVTGIIAEYNPFHRGHKYQIDYCKKELGADYVIVAMSGDYVQRGTPALLSKHVRLRWHFDVVRISCLKCRCR